MDVTSLETVVIFQNTRRQIRKKKKLGLNIYCHENFTCPVFVLYGETSQFISTTKTEEIHATKTLLTRLHGPTS